MFIDYFLRRHPKQFETPEHVFFDCDLLLIAVAVPFLCLTFNISSLDDRATS